MVSKKKTINPNLSKKIFYPNFAFLATTFETEKLNGQSKALKTCITA